MAEKLKIIPLGGLNEIGKNMTAYEYGGEIIVVEDGLIVERGTHSELIEQRGVYAQLHKMQFGQ